MYRAEELPERVERLGRSIGAQLDMLLDMERRELRAARRATTLAKLVIGGSFLVAIAIFGLVLRIP
jgi:hypothetical protein